MLRRAPRLVGLGHAPCARTEAGRARSGLVREEHAVRPVVPEREPAQRGGAVEPAVDLEAAMAAERAPVVAQFLSAVSTDETKQAHGTIVAASLRPMGDTHRQIGQRLRLARGSRTIRDIAERARVGCSAVTEIEQGSRVPRADTLERLAEALGVPPAWLAFGDEPRLCRRFGPKAADHPSIGMPCPACGVSFAAGDFTALVPLGPGADDEARESAQRGLPFNAVAVEVHFACATGSTAECSAS